MDAPEKQDDIESLKKFNAELVEPESKDEVPEPEPSKPGKNRRRKQKSEKLPAHLKRKVIGVDDTSVRLQDASLPGKMRTARFWLYHGQDDHPFNVFDFTESRGRDGPAEFLKDFRGHAVVDAYGVHDGIYLGNDSPTSHPPS